LWALRAARFFAAFPRTILPDCSLLVIAVCRDIAAVLRKNI
jgi:hypothetical protein